MTKSRKKFDAVGWMMTCRVEVEVRPAGSVTEG
jgi:hypothetical protein